MIQSRRIRRRQAAEGAYYPDAFSIRIESDPPLINPATLAMRMDDAEDFSTFVHEYWHYLQNLTTVAGFSSFELYHDLAARFHATWSKTATVRRLARLAYPERIARQSKSLSRSWTPGGGRLPSRD